MFEQFEAGSVGACRHVETTMADITEEDDDDDMLAV